MKKNVLDEHIAEFIKQCADEVRSQLDYQVNVAKSHMARTEQELIDTFTDEQKFLYNEYLSARQRYYDAVSNRYSSLNK